MAKPSGATDVGAHDLQISLITTTPKSLFFVHKINESPAELTSDGIAGRYPYHKMRYEVEVTSATSASLIIDSFISTSGYLDDETTVTSDVSTPTWQTAIHSERHPTTCTFTKFPNDPKPRYAVCELQISYSGSPTTLSIDAIALETKWTASGYDETQIDVELTEHYNPTDRVYRADYPISAWHIKRLLMDTYNSFLNNANTYYSIPVFGDMYVPV